MIRRQGSGNSHPSEQKSLAGDPGRDQGSGRPVQPASQPAVARTSQSARRIWRLGSRPYSRSGDRRYPLAIYLLLAAELLCSTLYAQQSPPTAQDLAHRVDRHYNQLHSLRAAFTESYEGMGMKRTESGTMLLEKPGRMRWDYASPSGKLFLLDGSFAWFYSPGDPQVQRLPAKDLDDLRSPLRFLLGHTSLEKEVTDLAIAPAPNGLYTLTGRPKGQQARVARLTLTVTPEGAIKVIEVEEADGAVTRFSFTGEEPNTSIPAGTFRFTPPPGVPVVGALPPV